MREDKYCSMLGNPKVVLAEAQIKILYYPKMNISSYTIYSKVRYEKLHYTLYIQYIRVLAPKNKGICF